MLCYLGKLMFYEYILDFIFWFGGFELWWLVGENIDFKLGVGRLINSRCVSFDYLIDILLVFSKYIIFGGYGYDYRLINI